MNIYEIGEEKCIDGVWGREVNGRFYTHYEASAVIVDDALRLCRMLDVSSGDSFWAMRGIELGFASKYEEVTAEFLSSPRKTKYTPKHIKDLENLKRGDVVWVKIHTSRGVMWSSTRFVRMDNYYITGDCFDNNGNIDMLFTCSHEEVFLKPPFDI